MTEQTNLFHAHSSSPHCDVWDDCGQCEFGWGNDCQKINLDPCSWFMCRTADLLRVVKSNRRLLEIVSLQGTLRNTHPNNSFLLKLGPKCRSDNIYESRGNTSKIVQFRTSSSISSTAPKRTRLLLRVNVQRLINYLPFSPQNEVRHDMRLDVDALIPYYFREYHVKCTTRCKTISDTHFSWLSMQPCSRLSIKCDAAV